MLLPPDAAIAPLLTLCPLLERSESVRPAGLLQAGAHHRLLQRGFLRQDGHRPHGGAVVRLREQIIEPRRDRFIKPHPSGGARGQALHGRPFLEPAPLCDAACSAACSFLPPALPAVRLLICCPCHLPSCRATRSSSTWTCASGEHLGKGFQPIGLSPAQRSCLPCPCLFSAAKECRKRPPQEWLDEHPGFGAKKAAPKEARK